VQEIAALAILALTAIEEGEALLSLVLAIIVVILAKLMGAMRELALGAIRAVPLLNILFAQLRLHFELHAGAGSAFRGR